MSEAPEPVEPDDEPSVDRREFDQAVRRLLGVETEADDAAGTFSRFHGLSERLAHVSAILSERNVACRSTIPANLPIGASVLGIRRQLSMAGVKQDENGKWQIDHGFLTPEREAILRRLDEKHEAAKSATQSR